MATLVKQRIQIGTDLAAVRLQEGSELGKAGRSLIAVAMSL